MKLLLVDGHYYAYRSFYAIRGLTNDAGEPTNAVFGFAKALQRMLQEVRPDLAAVVWDEGLPERRMELLPGYKQQRVETPADLAVQLPLLRELAMGLGLANVGLPGHEADDLLGSYARAAERAGMEVVLATNDKDLHALVTSRVRLYAAGKGSAAGFSLLGPAEVEEKWGVPPGKIPDLLALTGDAVDNIPGIEGVGVKTAAALLREHGGVRLLADNPGVVANTRLRERLSAGRQRLMDNLELVRLELDLPLPVPVGDLVIRRDSERLVALARRCGFRSLLREWEEAARVAGGSGPSSVQGELF